MTKSENPRLDVLHADGLYKHGIDFNHFNKIGLFLSLLPPSNTDYFSTLADTLTERSNLAHNIIIIMSGNDQKRKEFLKKLIGRKQSAALSLVRNKYAILPPELLDEAMISEIRLTK